MPKLVIRYYEEHELKNNLRLRMMFTYTQLIRQQRAFVPPWPAFIKVHLQRTIPSRTCALRWDIVVVWMFIFDSDRPLNNLGCTWMVFAKYPDSQCKQPMNNAYQWSNTSENYNIPNPGVTQLNLYLGGVYQQSTSGVMNTNSRPELLYTKHWLLFNIWIQVLSARSLRSGQDYVDNNIFVELSYDYYYWNLWRVDFGVVCVFFVGFLIIVFTATKFNTTSAFNTAVMLFKGTRAAEAVDESKDEEKGAHAEPAGPSSESGAGKTMLLDVLVQHVDVGVVTGDHLFSGQPLPPDFQAQIVNKCLVMCGLEDYADAVVGSLGVECCKCTIIGVELAAKPKL
ncbi:hypothetical protein F4604DRAFT_2000120 [Suillus subluteus]|nr:hypothetical protein F4604DRAFT_2000120 [Suillus subluteus]